MSKNWTKVEDNKVLAVWVPTCDGNCEQEPVEISPDFYEENGTPICMCGCDMRYSHTIVEVPTKRIAATSVIEVDTGIVQNVHTFNTFDDAAERFKEMVKKCIEADGDVIDDDDLNDMVDNGVFTLDHFDLYLVNSDAE